MQFGHRTAPLAIAIGIVLNAMNSAHADNQVYITTFTKDNNIYTNLNQQFPNTGPGVPGSGVGQPNSSFIFNPATYTSPNYIPGSNLTTNGVTFNITSDSAGHDFATSNSTPIFIAANLTDVTSFHLLVSAYFGRNVDVSFFTSGGTIDYSGEFVPDFNGGGPINQAYANGALDQTVLRVTDIGAGGTGDSSNGAFNNYDLTELSYTFATPINLIGATFTADGFAGLVLGATAIQSTPTTPVGAPAPLAGAGLLSFFGAGGIAMRKRARRMISRFATRKLALG